MSQNLFLNSQPNVTDCLLSRIAFPYLEYGLLNGLIINRKQQNKKDCYDGSPLCFCFKRLCYICFNSGPFHCPPAPNFFSFSKALSVLNSIPMSQTCGSATIGGDDSQTKLADIAVSRIDYLAQTVKKDQEWIGFLKSTFLAALINKELLRGYIASVFEPHPSFLTHEISAAFRVL